MLGTPHYLSPEQVAGQSATAASDFYALGVVAYECLTGDRPFQGEPMAVLIAQRDEPPPPVPESAPPALRELVTALLGKDPDKRPTDGAAIAAQAERMLGSESSATAPAPVAYPDEPVTTDNPPTSVLASPDATVVPEAVPAPVVPESVVAEPVGPQPVASEPAQRRRVPAWLIAAGAAAVCFAAAGIVAWTQSGGPSTPSAHAAGNGKTATLTPVHVASAQPFAEAGGSSDHPEEAPLAIDGNASTAWYTQHYATSSFGSLRSGSGLLLDLGTAVAVKRLVVQLAVAGTAVAVHAGDDPSSLLSAKTVGTSPSGPSAWTLRPGVTARYWLVWFTRLAPSDGAFRAGVADVSFAR
jgi:serine/threonine-protein kinase